MADRMASDGGRVADTAGTDEVTRRVSWITWVFVAILAAVVILAGLTLTGILRFGQPGVKINSENTAARPAEP